MRAASIAVVLLAACADPVAAPPVPAELVVLKAAPAITTPGGQIDTISVRLLDAQGQPVPGQRVEWSGDGQLVPLDSVTDELGLSHARWVLPRHPHAVFLWPVGPSGLHEARATWADLPAAHFETTTRAFVVGQFDAAFHYGCGIRATELWCWGWPLFGEPYSDVPIRVVLPSGIVPEVVRAASLDLCVLDAAGAVHCAAVYGDGHFSRISGLPPLSSLEQHGFNFQDGHFCGLARADRQAWCWVQRESIVDPPASAGSLAFQEIAVGGDFACGLDDAGAAWCWGGNEYGQLGDGSLHDSDVPVRVAGNRAFVSLAAERTSACAATAQGTIWCWGWGPFRDPEPVPVSVTTPGFSGTKIRMGSPGQLYILDGGTLRSWYELGDLQLYGLTPWFQFVEISDEGQSCAGLPNGEIYCSWILLHGGGDTSPYPSDLVPVPDPASQVSP